MSRARVGIVLASAALLGLAPGLATPAAAQDHGNPGTFWRGSAYLWWANIDGENQLGDAELTVGDSTKLYASFAGDFSYGKGRFRGVATFSTTSLSNQTELSGPGIPNGTLVNYDFSQTMAELFAWFQVGRFNTYQAFQLFGGLRYTRQRQKLLDGPMAGSFTETWVEPVGGAQYFVDMGGIFWATVTGNIGGIVFGSRFAYGVGAELGANLYGPLSLALSYRFLQTNYDNDDDGTGYRWDEGTTQGWYLGIVIKG
jgi:hypothetical protein